MDNKANSAQEEKPNYSLSGNTPYNKCDVKKTKILSLSSRQNCKKTSEVKDNRNEVMISFVIPTVYKL